MYDLKCINHNCEDKCKRYTPERVSFNYIIGAPNKDCQYRLPLVDDVKEAGFVGEIPLWERSWTGSDLSE